MLELPVLTAVFGAFFVTVEDVEEVLPAESLLEEVLLEVEFEDDEFDVVELGAGAA